MSGKFTSATLLLFFASLLHGQQTDDTAKRAMKDELTRSMSQLQLQQMDKPYFLAYRMQDITQKEISATLGSLTSSSGTPFHNRILGVELRVGDYALDNSNFFSMQRLRGGPAAMFGGLEQGATDDNYDQIRREYWLATDKQYKRALEDLAAKKAALKMRKTGETIPDFSKETATELRTERPPAKFNPSEMATLARDLSAVFRSAPEIDRSSVTITFRDVYTRYVNSEGSAFTRSDPLFKLEVSAHAHAPDGLPISDSLTLFGHTAADFPSKADLRARVEQMSATILKLRSAATVESYNGPVLFEGPAAGEILLQQFAPRLAASRTPMSDNPQFELVFNQMLNRLGGASFQDKIGARILPDFLSLRDDPTQPNYNGLTLMGNVAVDDDGVKSRETVLVEHGILKNLLSSRSPVRGVLQSTGSRHGWGAAPSNLVLKSEKTLNPADLKRELLQRAKDRGLDYAIVIRRVGAGSAASFIEMAKRMAQQGSSESSLPEVYKLYADGHEEPLRGIHIADLPAESFKEIIATGDAPAVYSDEILPRMTSLFSMAVASGGNLPIVSCVTPSLLFEEISLAKSEGPFPAPPISSSPLAEK
jgi:PmbA/TldA metallopeptidase C-terminal domain